MEQILILIFAVLSLLLTAGILILLQQYLRLSKQIHQTQTSQKEEDLLRQE